MRKARLNYLLGRIQDLKPATEGFYYRIDFNSVYGGYRLELVKKETGAVYGCFGGNGCEPRLTYRNFEMKLSTIVSTLNEN